MSWPLTAVCVGWIAGTAWHLESVHLQAPTVYACWVVCALFVWWGSSRSICLRVWLSSLGVVGVGVRMLCVATLSAALAMGIAGWRAAMQSAQRLAPTLEGVDLVLVGVVSRLPQLQSQGVRFWFDVERAHRLHGPDVAVPVPSRVVLGWQGGSGSEGEGPGGGVPPVRAGDRWRLPVRLKVPHGLLNPQAADTEVWWWSNGVMATGQVRLSVSREMEPARLASAVAHPIERWRQACRDRLWQQGLEPRVTGIVSALLLGDQAAIDPIDWDVFRRTGVAHLMSISGLHITLLAAVMRRVIAWMWAQGTWRRRPLGLLWPASSAGGWGGLITAGLYAVFSGGGVPAQRTVWMLGVSVLLRTWGLRWPWWASWLLACAVVLAWEPWAWLQASFWLSFIAVGLLMALDDRSPAGGSEAGVAKIQTRRTTTGWRTGEQVQHQTAGEGTTEGGREEKSAGSWSRPIRPQQVLVRGWLAFLALWREQWHITLGLAPLTLLVFREVSLIGWLANWIAIPWVTLCVTPLSMLGVVWPGAWQLAALALEGLQWGLNGLLLWGVPTWSVAAFPVWVAVAGVLGAGWWCLPAPLWLRWWGLPLMVPALGWQASSPQVGEVEVVVADVGQGQAVLLRTARHALLYDAGPRYSSEMDAGQRVVVPLLQAYGVRLDRLVLSHRDTDHTGGALAVLAMQPRTEVLGSLPGRWALARRENYQDCEAGQSWVWDGVHFEMLHPLASGPTRSASNAWSCVLRVRTAHSSLLLTGDIEASEEAVLVQRLGAALQTDVMLVPHHGSRTSSTAAWLDAVQPRMAWVQAGYRNRFGHPAPDVMARYRARQISVLETARCGAILWSSEQPMHTQCERERRRRYWHHLPP